MRVKIESLRYVVDVNTLSRDREAEGLELNGIGRVVMSAVRPLYVDAYRDNRATGSLVLIDQLSNATVGAGTLIERQREEELPSAIAEWHDDAEASGLGSVEDSKHVTSEERAARACDRSRSPSG